MAKNGRPLPDWFLGKALCELRDQASTAVWNNLWIKVLLFLSNLFSIVFVTGLVVAFVDRDIPAKHPHSVYLMYAGVMGAFISALIVFVYHVIVKPDEIRLDDSEELRLEDIKEVVALDSCPSFAWAEEEIYGHCKSIVANMAAAIEQKEKWFALAETPEKKAEAEIDLFQARLTFAEHFNALKAAKLLPGVEKRSLFQSGASVK